MQQYGINFGSDYPYETRQTGCRRKSRNVTPSIIKSVGFSSQNENDMYQKLQAVGPIQVAGKNLE